ncbi:mediator of RNA polymerase II transcription subunit 14-like [Musa acuminata AAA Group]|uniref:mediator of RNA polymerase II transcription subunit 14-like n=1 Tax=Musa acuminata AAA Group TaxID=214697 RepID=UPI0031D7D026
MAAELGQQTVEFSALVRRAAEDSYLALKELVERSRAPEDQRSDSEKKIDLLKFIAKTRQRMLHLHVLAKWCRQAKFKINAIRFELISDGTAAQGANTSALQLAQDGELDSTGLKTPGLKIIYWLDADKNAGGSDFSSRPFLKLEPGQDTQIKCLHNSFVLDPLTGKEAIFSLDQSCIDLEKLLLKAIACNIHTRLFEIQRELSKSVNICRGTGDVVLKNDGSMVADLRKKDENSSIEDYFGDEVLKVRACGMSFITLGINIRECQNQSKWFLKV